MQLVIVKVQLSIQNCCIDETIIDCENIIGSILLSLNAYRGISLISLTTVNIFHPKCILSNYPLMSLTFVYTLSYLKCINIQYSLFILIYKIKIN